MNGSRDCIGIVYGSGDYPKEVLKACIDKRIDCCVVFVGDSCETFPCNVPSIQAKIGKIAPAINFFHEHKVNKIVLAGAIKRPNFKELSLDSKGASWLLKLGKAILGGDDALLRAVSKLLEEEGFEIISGTSLLGDIFLQSGVFSKRLPTESDWFDIKKGFERAKEIGRMDIGQSVIACGGEILGIEGIDGTDALIKECAKLRKTDFGGVLIKASKPQQDHRLDLPTVGIKTVIGLHENAFSGLAIESGCCIVLNKKEVIEKCNKFSMFFVGIGDEYGV